MQKLVEEGNKRGKRWFSSKTAPKSVEDTVEDGKSVEEEPYPSKTATNRVKPRNLVEDSVKRGKPPQAPETSSKKENLLKKTKQTATMAIEVPDVEAFRQACEDAWDPVDGDAPADLEELIQGVFDQKMPGTSSIVTVEPKPVEEPNP